MHDRIGPAPAVAVVVVSYRSAEDIRGLISAIDRQTTTPTSIHVCENGGEAAFDVLSGLLAEAFGQAETAHPKNTGSVVRTTILHRKDAPTIHCHLASSNLGYAGAINAVIGQLEGADWTAIWIVNPDATPESEALTALAHQLRRRDVGVVGGRLVYSETGRLQADGGVWRKWLARGLNINFGCDPAAPVDPQSVEERMDYVSGACMLVTRNYVEHVGLMEEGYFLYCEEVDWCARRNGYRLAFAPDAIVRHGHGATIGSHRDRRRRSRLSIYLDERNRLLFTRRHHPRIYPIVVATSFLLLLQYVRHGAFENFRHGLGGWFAGLRGETGPPSWFAGADVAGVAKGHDKAAADGRP